jgi:hypothetical protein
MSGVLLGEFRGRGVDPGKARAAAGVAARVAEQVQNLSSEQFSDSRTRNREAGRLIGRALEAAGHADVLAAVPEGDREAYLSGLADRALGAANEALPRQGYARNLQFWHRAGNPAVLAGGESAALQAKMASDLQSALSGVTSGSMLRRGVDAFRNFRPGDDPREFLARTFGGVPVAEINPAVASHMFKLDAVRRRALELQEKVAATPAGAGRAEVMAQYERAVRDVGTHAAELSKAAGAGGGFLTGGLSSQDLRHALDSARGARSGDASLIGLTAGLPGNAADVANARATPGQYEALARQYAGANTREEVRELADLRARAARLGVGGWEVTGKLSDEVANIRSAIEAEGDRHRGIGKDLADPSVRRERQKESRDAFREFWATDGPVRREEVELRGRDVANVADKLLRSPQAIQRYGTRGLEISSALRTGEERLQELSARYAGGDMARLVTGDLSVDLGTDQGVSDFKRVRAEVRAIDAERERLYRELAAHSGPGRFLELGGGATQAERERSGNEREALRLLGVKDKGLLGPEEQAHLSRVMYDVSIARRLTPEDEGRLFRYEEEAAKGPPTEAATKQVSEVAARLGVDFKDLAGATQVGRAMAAAQAAAVAAADISPAARSRELLGLFGMTAGDGLSEALGGPRGSAAGRRLAEAAGRLSGRAGGQGPAGAAGLADEFRRARREGGASLERFRQANGLADDDAFGQFQKDVDFLDTDWSGKGGRFLDLMRNTAGGESKLAELIQKAGEAGQADTTSGQGRAEGGPMTVDGTLRVYFVGDNYQADLHGTAAGRGHTVRPQ